MIHRLPSLLALSLAFAPAMAWAHGDHHGLRGVVHVLTEPEHLGLVLFGLIVASMALSRRRHRPRHGNRHDAT